jgi:hypothetical protein
MNPVVRLTPKRLLQVSGACAVAIQAVFVLGYGWMTNWVFGAPLTSGPPKLVPDVVIQVVESAALLQQLGLRFQVGDLTSTLLSALVNTIAWTGLLFALFTVGLQVIRRSSRRDSIL